MIEKKKIAVGVSGGVDSSVSAYLLKKENYDVHGVFIKITNPLEMHCTSEKDREDSMKVCATLGIPFIEYDLSDEYNEKVIKPFVESYRIGDTPNPDVLCNHFIKFGELYRLLKEDGFPLLATGHYAQVKKVGENNKLLCSVDKDKDQTYFIYTMSQGILNSVVFPIGGYTKKQVRSIASEANLFTADKSDSTGLCFLGDISMKNFLSSYIDVKDGDVVSIKTKEVVGRHNGACLYTIGQRHGFSVNIHNGAPHYVVGKDIENNVIFVDTKDYENTELVKEFKINNVVLREFESTSLFARYRHRGELHKISLEKANENTATVIFEKPQIIATGQSIVIYTKDCECIGGGVVV